MTEVYVGPIRHDPDACGKVCACWCESCTKGVHGIGAERIEELSDRLRARADREAAPEAPGGWTRDDLEDALAAWLVELLSTGGFIDPEREDADADARALLREHPLPDAVSSWLVAALGVGEAAPTLDRERVARARARARALGVARPDPAPPSEEKP